MHSSNNTIHNANSSSVMSLKLIVFITIVFNIGVSEAKLRAGFYNQTCPQAEAIVASVVNEAAASNSRIPAILLRLHFHDCFVEGCDGSILIDNGEKGAFAHQGVEGFVEVDKAKTRIDAVCPGVVSCADIVALAAREAIVLSKGPFYQVETGRRDGLVSNIKLADNMPDAADSIQILKSKFRNKGFSEKELVILSGAHTIGTTACFFVTPRLYDQSNQPDPSINPSLLPELRNKCPKGGPNDVRLPLDMVSSELFDDQILRNINDGFAVIASDAKLKDDNITRQVIDSYIGSSASRDHVSFQQDFVRAMLKVGRLAPTNGKEGEIRRNCRAFN